jgi:hypothetical protein
MDNHKIAKVTIPFSIIYNKRYYHTLILHVKIEIVPFCRTLLWRALIFSNIFSDITDAVLPSIMKQTQCILWFNVGEATNPVVSGVIGVDGLN